MPDQADSHGRLVRFPMSDWSVALALYVCFEASGGFISVNDQAAVSDDGSALVSVWLSVEGDDPVEGLAELADWLGQESDLRGLVSPVPAVPGPGELGALTDTLVAAVGSGGAISILAASLKVFLAQPHRSDVRIVLRTADGRRVEVDAKRVGDVEALVRETLSPAE